MKIELYKSALCPRCTYLTGVLKKLQSEMDDLEIVSFDIATDIKAFKAAKIRMIPALRIDDRTASWVIPRASQIRDFILENR